MYPPLDKIVHQILLNERRPPTGLLHCSSHSHWPLRFTQLSQIFSTDEEDVGSLTTMKIGTLTHDWLEGAFQAEGVLGPDWELIEVEKDITEYLPVGWTGRIDYIFRHIPTKTYSIGDLKTIKAESAAWLGDRPKPEHTTQVSCYHAGFKRFMPGIPVFDDVFVLYLPKSKDSRQQTIPPVIKTAPAEPSAWANMVGIKRQVDQYVAEFELTGDPLNRFLAPMPLPEPRVSWNKAQNSWDVVMRPSWTEEYIGIQFGDLCPRTPSQKLGHWSLDGAWIPRKGIQQPDYESIPRPSREEIDRRRR